MRKQRLVRVRIRLISYFPRVSSEIMCSFDVCSLFTNVPLDETIQNFVSNRREYWEKIVIRSSTAGHYIVLHGWLWTR